MKTTIAELKTRSRIALAGNYGVCAFALIISVFFSFILSNLLSFITFGLSNIVLLYIVNFALNVVLAVFNIMMLIGSLFLSLNVARYSRPSISNLFLAFRYESEKAVKLCLILGLINTICMQPIAYTLSQLLYFGKIYLPGYTAVSVPMIILVIAGSVLLMAVLELIIAFPFSQALFLYIDHQDYTPGRCLKESTALMKGNRFAYLKMHLSLLGYYALCIASLGAGALWVFPYLNVTKAGFYMELSGNYNPY